MKTNQNSNTAQETITQEKGSFIKKFVTLIIVTACLSILGISTSYFLNEKKLAFHEEFAQKTMHSQFEKLVKTWDISLIPALFVENAEINNISKLLLEAKNKMGACTIKNVSKCQANKRLKEQKTRTSADSQSCKFSLDCEKVQATGEDVFLPTHSSVKIYEISLEFN